MLAATRLPANTLQGMMQLCCEQLLDDGNTFYSQRVFDLFPQMATTEAAGWAHIANGSMVFGSNYTSDSGNDSDYLQWTVHVPAGNYKLHLLYPKHTNRGIASISINGGALFDSCDQYDSPGSVANVLFASSTFALNEGSNTIRVQKNGKNASSSSYLLHFAHAQLIKQDATSALTSVANVPHIINVPVVFADSHTNWNTLTLATSYMFGTLITSTAVQNATITYSFWAPKGNFTLALLHHQSTTVGIYTITVDGNSIGTVDGYFGSTRSNQLDTTLTGTLATTGIHTITFTMATKNASSSAYYGVIHHIQIRMTSITEPLAADLAPEVALFWPVFNEGNTTWSTATVSGSQAYYYYYVSGGAQNSEITLSTNTVLRPGTYRLDLLVVTLSSIGKYHVLVDTVDLGNYDGYSVGTVNNVVGTIGSLALTGYTPHTIKLKMSDKNASSSNYVGRLTLARLIRTGS